jgi:organic hydroperoxide reductase OsmC/OhrA
MKRNFLSIAILAVVISLSSCGSSSSSFENDVRKMADYQCKMTKLSVTAATDEKAKKELEELSKEVTKFAKEMEKKYESKKDDKEMEAKAEAIMKEAMEKCK